MTFIDCKLHLGLNSGLVSLKITLVSINITRASLNSAQVSLGNGNEDAILNKKSAV